MTCHQKPSQELARNAWGGRDDQRIKIEPAPSPEKPEAVTHLPIACLLLPPRAILLSLLWCLNDMWHFLDEHWPYIPNLYVNAIHKGCLLDRARY